jgi:predicted DCC family thiol-disulfide oxidoreductase YuxK
MSAPSTTAATTRPTVVFDGGCSFCRRQERRIRRLDWLGRFDTCTYDDAVEVWPEVGRGTLGDGLRVRFPDGTVTVGVDAVRSIAVRLPLTSLPSLLLWVPGLHGIGAWGYGIVARRRQRDSTADDACAI